MSHYAGSYMTSGPAPHTAPGQEQDNKDNVAAQNAIASGPADEAWREGYRQRVLHRSENMLVPDWAVPPPDSMINVYLDCYKQEGVTLVNIHLYEHLQEHNMVLFGRLQHERLPTVILEHPSISRTHAAIVMTRDGLMLFDLKSLHGTFLNGRRIQPNIGEPIFEYDVISFGSSTRQYKLKQTGGRRRAEGEAYLLQRAQRARAAAAHDQRQAAAAAAAGLPAPMPSGSAVGPHAGLRPPSEVRVRHLLVKHKDVRRPSSWKSPVITRTREEAIAMIEEFRQRIVNGVESFEELAARESDCNSHTRGGDLGSFGRGKMQPAFETAAFSLAVGELSGPVHTDSGVHIILRIA